jgi:hypothetical protein
MEARRPATCEESDMRVDVLKYIFEAKMFMNN